MGTETFGDIFHTIYHYLATSGGRYNRVTSLNRTVLFIFRIEFILRVIQLL
jgi:hypothetical protein